jgi:hypothetical protein
MPELPAITSPPCVRVEFDTNLHSGVLGGSRFFLSYAGSPPSEGDLNTLATAISTAWYDAFAGAVSNVENLASVTVTDLSSATGAVGFNDTVQNGTRAGDELIGSACVVINHKVGRRYRGGRPRTYVRAGTMSDLTGTNQWSEGSQAEFLSLWEGWISNILGTSGIGITLQNIVNISLYKGSTVFIGPTGRARNIPTPRTDPAYLIDVITSSEVSPKVGTQRRRLDI